MLGISQYSSACAGITICHKPESSCFQSASDNPNDSRSSRWTERSNRPTSIIVVPPRSVTNSARMTIFMCSPQLLTHPSFPTSEHSAHHDYRQLPTTFLTLSRVQRSCGDFAQVLLLSVNHYQQSSRFGFSCVTYRMIFVGRVACSAPNFQLFLNPVYNDLDTAIKQG